MMVRIDWRIPMKSPEQAAFKAILIVTVLIALVMLPLVARAKEHGSHGPPAFQQFDADGSGFVSEEEFNATRAARHAKMAEEGRQMKGMATAPAFSDLDTDGDGQLSEVELVAGQKAHRAAMRKGKQGKGMHHGMGHGKGMKMPTFPDLDLDGNGCIDAEEFARHQAERHGAPAE